MILKFNKYIKENNLAITTIDIFKDREDSFFIPNKVWAISEKLAYYIFIQLILFALKNNYKYTIAEKYYQHLVINFYDCHYNKEEILNSIKINKVPKDIAIIKNIIKNILLYDAALFKYYVIQDLIKMYNITEFNYLDDANKFDLI